jgi:hypothetical protein
LLVARLRARPQLSELTVFGEALSTTLRDEVTLSSPWGSWSEGVTPHGLLHVPLGESVTLSETVVAHYVASASLAETVAWTEQVHQQAKYALHLLNTVGLSEGIVAGQRFTAALHEIVTLTDSIHNNPLYAAYVAEEIPFAEAVQTRQRFGLSLSETVSQGELLSAIRRVVVQLAETIPYGEALTTLLRTPPGPPRVRKVTFNLLTPQAEGDVAPPLPPRSPPNPKAVEVTQPAPPTTGKGTLS